MRMGNKEMMGVSWEEKVEERWRGKCCGLVCA